MVSLHQSRLPWSIIVEYHRQKRRPARNPSKIDRSLEPEADPKLMERVDHFSEKLEHVIKEFSATESAKYDRKTVDAIKKLYPDAVIDEILVERFQTPKGWNDWIKKNRQELSGGTMQGGQLADVVKELFNRDMMAPLLYLARNVSMIDRLSWITYSNFFHYGYRRVLEDALTCYLLINYLVVSDQIFQPEALPQSLDHFLSKEDWNASLTVYSKLIGNYRTDGIPDPNIKELQKFSFRCLYQYQLFWDEVCGASKAKRIDWHNEVRRCLESIL